MVQYVKSKCHIHHLLIEPVAQVTYNKNYDQQQKNSDSRTIVNTHTFLPYISAANCHRVANLVPYENIEPNLVFLFAQNLEFQELQQLRYGLFCGYIDIFTFSKQALNESLEFCYRS